MPSGVNTVPANAIVIEGNPVRLQLKAGANATLAKLLPGIFVTYDAADNAVKEAGDEDDLVVGILDVLPNKGIDDQQATAAGDPLIVLTGNFRGVVRIVNGGTATTLGIGLTTAADGYAKVLAVGAMGSQGPPVGRALMAVNPAASALKCTAEINIEVEPTAAS